MSKQIEIGSKVIVNFAGSKQAGEVVAIKKDGTKYRVKKTTGGLPLWYEAQFVTLNNGSKRTKPENVQTQAQPAESTAAPEENKPAQEIKKEVIVKGSDKDVDVAPLVEVTKLSKKQAAALEFIKDKTTASTGALKEHLTLAKVAVMTLMRSLETSKLVSATADAGEMIYTVTEKGKTLEYEETRTKRAGKGQGFREKIIDMLKAGKPGKEIYKELGCDPSYVTDMKNFLKIEAAIKANPEAGDKEIAGIAGTTQWNVKYHRPRVK